MKRDRRFQLHNDAWRDPAQVASQWEAANTSHPSQFRFTVRGSFWEVLEASKATLLVTREYEHLIIAMSVTRGRPNVTYFPLPHPSGLVCERRRAVVHVASTRNPNQIVTFRPTKGPKPQRPLVPVACRYYPGRAYLHDLALVGGVVHANTVGANAVARVLPDGSLKRAWWPRCIETRNGPQFDQNYIQLNSIAAGPTLRRSFFSASSDRIGSRRPGHRNYPVDRRGVIFSGATRQPIVRGLTRPHSARLYRNRLFVANSGYGELGVVNSQQERFEPIVQLPGWTRGLVFLRGVAIAGTSRVLPRFRSYAPGLDIDDSECGLHVVDLRTGTVTGSLRWPEGNQIFALDWLPNALTLGFPFAVGRRQAKEATRTLFYSFETASNGVSR